MRFVEALEELGNRVAAVAHLERDNEETVATVVGEPNELIRQVISGYVPTDDTDHVMEFLHNAGRELTVMLRNTDSPAAAHAGVRFTVAQMIVLGVVLGRGDSAKMRRVADAAEAHLARPNGASATTELREALEAIGR